MRFRPHAIATVFAAAFSVSFGLVQANGQEASKPAVNPDSLERVSWDIKYLAADVLEGRGVQTKGLAVAADYIREEYKKMGLKGGAEDGSFYQNFDVRIREKLTTDGTSMKLTIAGDERPMEVGKDFQPLQVGGPAKREGDIVFVGYGIKAPDLGYDDYEGIDVEDKIVLVIRREPQQKDEDSKFGGTENTEHSYVATKMRVAKEAGARGILFVNDGVTEDYIMQPAEFGTAADVRLPITQISRETGNALIAASPVTAGDKKLKSLDEIEKYIDEEYKPCSAALDSCSAAVASNFKTKQVKAWNVIGVLEGEGPLADETVVVGAHYDHLGYGGYGSRRSGSSEVHNGADDNATGTAAVLELARRFASAEKKPARRMVFIAFSGEERGLVGSAYYVNNPTFPLEKTIAMLNFDMIGNLRNNTATLGGTSTGTGLLDVAKAADGKVPVEVNMPAGLSGGSDHLNFARKRVPVMFCNTGLTDLYHTPEDDYETLNMPGTVLVVDFCEELLKGVVAMEKRPEFFQQQRRRPARASLGVQTAEPEEGLDGVSIIRVVAGSAAAEAGLKVGDRLLKAGDREIKDRTSIRGALALKRPGDKLKVIFKRDDEEKEVEVKLGGRR